MAVEEPAVRPGTQQARMHMPWHTEVQVERAATEEDGQHAHGITDCGQVWFSGVPRTG